MNKENITFALDIGTRTVIGLLLKEGKNKYEIVESEVVEHDTRAMLDGQIHNVNQVARQVKIVRDRLEDKVGIELKKVSIAAAGRALKTITREQSINFGTKKRVTQKDVQQLEYAGVQAAQRELAHNSPEQRPGDYHFVGYSVIEYQLDDLFIKNLVGQRGNVIRTKLIATFLPRIVIDSLLSVINQVDLEVEHLTLEPIAASHMVIPREMYNFNLALIDIGAGTADIAITRGGTMTGYAMVPVAGDEITESLAEEYMLDYKKAEDVKRRLISEDSITTRNILGSEITVEKYEAFQAVEPEVKRLVELVVKEIFTINEKSPQALMCIGGGSLTPLLTEKLASALELEKNRVGIRDCSDLETVRGRIRGIEGTQALTPIGIAVTSCESQSQTIFVNVEVNGNNVQIFSLEQPTISDALLTAEVDLNQLKGKPGMGLTCTVNGDLKTVKGDMGSQGKIFLNGKRAQLEDVIKSGDKIEFKPGREGKDASAVVADVIPENLTKKSITLDDTEVTIKPEIYQNGNLVKGDSPLLDGASIKYHIPETISEAVGQILEISPDNLNNEVIEYKINGEDKYIAVSDFLIWQDGNLVEPEDSIREGIRLNITESEVRNNTISEVFHKTDTNLLTITFNNSQLDIPARRREFICNGEKVNQDYEIKNGDQITVTSQPLTVNKVLEYIKYNISDSMKSEMELKINDSPADFDDQVVDGDQINIYFQRSKKGGNL